MSNVLLQEYWIPGIGRAVRLRGNDIIVNVVLLGVLIRNRHIGCGQNEP